MTSPLPPAPERYEPLKLHFESNPLARAAIAADEAAGGFVGWEGMVPEVPLGSVTGWKVATAGAKLALRSPGQEPGVRMRWIPALCFTLLARANYYQRVDEELEPGDLLRLADDSEFRAQLMQGEDDPIMLAWFAPEGQWDCYGPRQSLEMVMPWLQMLS